MNLNLHSYILVCWFASAMSDSVRSYGLWLTRLLCPRDSPGKTLEWVAMPSSRGSSLLRDRTHVSYLISPALVGRFFTTSDPY